MKNAVLEPVARRVLAAIGCGFMLALFPPLVVLSLNGDAVRFPLWHILASGSLAAACLGGCLALLARAPRTGGGVADTCRVATLVVFILVLFPNPTGEVTGMDEFLLLAGNVVPLLKIVNILALLLLLRWKKRPVFDALHDLVLMCAAVVALGVVAGFRSGGGGGAAIPLKTRVSAARLGPAGNIIVVVPDAFTGYRMAEVLAADPTLAEAFDGFKFHPHAIACAFNTLAGISTLLTGDLDVARDKGGKYRRIERMVSESWLQEALDQGHDAVYFSHLLLSITVIGRVP